MLNSASDVVYRRFLPAVFSVALVLLLVIQALAQPGGSPYIELDSWIYGVVERLAALGVIRDDYLGLRPWTRMAVHKMIDEVDITDSMKRPPAL